jgi:glutathione peroxidase-family protein
MLTSCAKSCHVDVKPLPSEFYQIRETDINGYEFKFSKFMGKVVYIVNTASYCGYTKENFDLFKILSKYQSQGLEIVIAPCNQVSIYILLCIIYIF